MLLTTALTCLLGLAVTAPIVQKDVLDELVTQSLDRVSNPPVQQTNTSAISIQPQLPITPGVPGVLPVPGVPDVPGDRQQFGAQQTAPHSSSESESSEQSETVETPTALPLETTSEESDSESDSNTSEQTSESQDVTTEDTTSEETASPLPAQLAVQMGLDGDLGDDSQGSEETVRRSWLHAFRRNFHRQIHAGNIVVATPPAAVEPVAATVGVNTGGSATVAPTLISPAPKTPVDNVDSVASESNESQEGATLQQWRECRERADNGDCIPHGAVNDDGTVESNLNLGALRLEEDHGHMTI